MLSSWQSAICFKLNITNLLCADDNIKLNKSMAYLQQVIFKCDKKILTFHKSSKKR